MRTPWLGLLAVASVAIALAAYSWDALERHPPESSAGSKRPELIVESPPPKASPARTVTGTVRAGAAAISGRLDAPEIEWVIRKSFGPVLLCYEQGLAREPGLEGKLVMRFVIGSDGTVSDVTSGMTFPDATVAACIRAVFNGLAFPKPDRGIVTVMYPLTLARE